MKKWIALVLTILLTVSFMSCSISKHEAEIVETISTDLATYYEMSDGTWKTDDHVYQHRLEVTGEMPNTDVEATFVYLSNLESITFEQAWKAAGLSSHTADYFSVEDAVLVEWVTE